MKPFSDELITEVIRYFGERYDRILTPQEAEEYLASLAELYWCFTESVRRGFKGVSGGGGSAAAGGEPPPNPSSKT
jgi:hypothetical protein